METINKDLVWIDIQLKNDYCRTLLVKKDQAQAMISDDFIENYKKLFVRIGNCSLRKDEITKIIIETDPVVIVHEIMPKRCVECGVDYSIFKERGTYYQACMNEGCILSIPKKQG